MISLPAILRWVEHVLLTYAYSRMFTVTRYDCYDRSHA
jgi:hypothetical protein